MRRKGRPRRAAPSAPDLEVTYEKANEPHLTAVAVSGALSLLLGAAAGTQTDPLVTLSYLNDVNTPAILKEVDARLDTREQALVDKLNASIAQYEKDMEEQLAAAGGGTASSSAVFAVVTVKAGQKLLGGVGCEFLLRSGSAVCVAASAPGLIDSTDGATLASGGAIQPNHLYLSTAEGRGLQAGSDATVLVRGSYQIS